MRPRFIGGVLAALVTFAPAAEAAHVTIVALGASNTYGQGRGRTNGGVSPSQAWPAQLQALLRARGLDATVKNEGVPGDTTGGMLARLNSAVPDGPALVILQPGGNDRRRGQGGARAGNIADVKSRLAARHIKVLVLGHMGQIAGRATRDPDGQHFNAQGHAAIARSLVPRVMAVVH
jgi:acyl-CoA thioesterase-1